MANDTLNKASNTVPTHNAPVQADIIPLNKEARIQLIAYNVLLSLLLGGLFYWQYSDASSKWENKNINALIAFDKETTAINTQLKESISNNQKDTTRLRAKASHDIDSCRIVKDKIIANPSLPKDVMLRFILICTLLAGGLGGVLSNLRGIYYAFSTFGQFDSKYEIPYYLRPVMGMINGMFAFLVSNFFTYNFNPSTERPGWQSFDGLMPYIGVAFLAGFAAQEFAVRLKEIARAVFAYKNTATMPDELGRKSKSNDELFAAFNLELQKIEGFLNVEQKYDESKEGHPLSIFVSVKDNSVTESISRLKSYIDISKTNIPIIIKPSTVAKLQFKAYNAKVGTKRYSTIGGFLIDAKSIKYGLGTCHGLKENLSIPNKFLDSEDISIKKDDTEIGELEYIVMNYYFDIGLVRLHEPNDQFTNISINNPTSAYVPTEQDVTNKLAVQFFSTVENNTITGILDHYNVSDIYFESKDLYIPSKFLLKHNLVAIKHSEQNKAISVDGDSGAWVTTKINDEVKVIGMILGASDNKTYLIKMQDILNLYSSIGMKILS